MWHSMEISLSSALYKDQAHVIYILSLFLTIRQMLQTVSCKTDCDRQSVWVATIPDLKLLDVLSVTFSAILHCNTRAIHLTLAKHSIGWGKIGLTPRTRHIIKFIHTRERNTECYQYNPHIFRWLSWFQQFYIVIPELSTWPSQNIVLVEEI